MDAANQKTLSKLLKKLSALRITLNDEERNLLDIMMVGEVEAHRFETGKITAKSTAKSTAKATDADEVEAHVMNQQSEAPSVKIVFDPTAGEYRLN